jgi:hypothetical protein
MTFYGEKTELVQRAITELVRPGEEFEVYDLAVLLEAHATCSSGTAISRGDVNKAINQLIRRKDKCLQRVARGRYLFCGFGQATQTGRIRQATRQPRGHCPTCHLELTTEGLCGLCD